MWECRWFVCQNHTTILNLQPCSILRCNNLIVIVVRFEQELIFYAFFRYITCIFRMYITEWPSVILMVVTVKSILDQIWFRSKIFHRIIISFQSIEANLIVSQSYEFCRQDPQRIGNTDTFNETYASITTLDICIRFVLTVNIYRILETYQIFSSFEARDSRSSVNTMFCVCNITVFVYVRTIFRTRFTRSSSKIVMCNRNQVLRFDITSTTINPSSIDLEWQTCCFVSCPHTQIVNISISQVAIVFIHQVFLTDSFEESQAVTAVRCAFTQCNVVETTIQRSCRRFNSESRSSCFIQQLNFQTSTHTVISDTDFLRNTCILNFSSMSSSIIIRFDDSIEVFTIIVVVFFKEECINNHLSIIVCYTHWILASISFNQTILFVFSNDIIRSFQLSQSRNLFQKSGINIDTIFVCRTFNQSIIAGILLNIDQRIFTCTVSNPIFHWERVQIIEFISVDQQIIWVDMFVT